MKPRAFVVMPFGKRHPVEIQTKSTQYESKTDDQEVDFELVFNSLLKPALKDAGCDAFRADCETAAGDIRTDMFFELVTADLVVADISISNPNVFYELGVRHGVCPHGVFVVQGNWGNRRPFDVAPDRSFMYDGSLFVVPASPPAVAKAPDEENNPQKRIRAEVERLSQTFKHALASESLSVGSPVYEHLPGLEPVNWENIQTSRARFFGALRDDWLDCVRSAQSKGHPGDILTLAEDAPTRAHRSKILYQAALALIDLCRYRAAEEVLRDVIQENAKHFNAQLQLALVLAQQGKTDQADHQLRGILREHHDHPHASDLLGQVFRHLWHLGWRNEEAALKKQKAIETSHLAASAIHSFLKAQRFDSRAYFAGFNALILIALLRDLHTHTGDEICDLLPNHLGEVVSELTTVVRFSARNAREQALQRGDYVEQFWTTTTLAGLEMMSGDPKKGLRGIREACSIPGATFFQVHSFRERLLLLNELEFKPEFVPAALQTVERTFLAKNKHCTCHRVFLWAGEAVDRPDQLSRHSFEECFAAIERQIDDALESWKVGKNDLAICEGVYEADLLFAEACYRRGARVRLMLLNPPENGSPHALWPFRSAEIEQRFHDLRSSRGIEVWFHSDHLGSVSPFSGQTPRDIRQRHKRWLINTARMEAEQVLTSEPIAPMEQSDGPNDRLFGLVLWDGHGTGEDPDDPSYFVRLVNEFGGYRGRVKIISTATQRAIEATA
jgi:tetratricopeptide (TPR) repeat protein